MLISQVPLINMRRFAPYSNTCKGIQAILIIINHDYNVVIDPYSYHHIIMKLIILRLNTANKPSPMSEGVMEIRINNQPCKVINLTTWHTQARRAPWVATIHNVTKKLGRVSPRPSVIFHAYASTNTPWVAWTLSHYTSMKRGKVLSNSSTHEAT
jgi:hypothetical protein